MAVYTSYSDDEDRFGNNLKLVKTRPISIDGISLTNSLKRGLKLKEHSEHSGLSETLKKGLRKQALKSTEQPNQNAEPTVRKKHSISYSLSPSKYRHSVDDPTDANIARSTIAERRLSRSPSSLTVVDVFPYQSPFDDTASMIEGLLLDSSSIRKGEAVRDTIGRKHVVILKKMVKLEKSQSSRVDPKVLVLTPYRCQLLGVKPPFKLEADFHYLDIKSMDSPSVERLTISTKTGKIYFLQLIGSDDADHIIGRITLALRTIFPNVTISRILKATLEPLSRQKAIQSMLNQADESEAGPCGNFSEMYRCVCDYLNCPVREDVEWDVDTIYLSQNCREINLSDFELPESRDVIPIITVMVYNQWFEGLVVRSTKLSSEVLEYILKVVRSSLNLKELVLDGVGMKGDFPHRLSTSLMDNKESCLEVLDLSNNPIDDKGLLHISGVLPLIKRGSIRRLTFSRAGLTAKGINGLCQSIRSSYDILGSLTHLDLSENVIKTDEAEGLYSFLSNENHLTDLDLSATDCSVDAYLSALAKGCTKYMKNIKLGRNHFHGKKRDSTVTSSFQEFFENAASLKSVDFSHMKFPTDALKCVMTGLLRNKTTGLAVELNLSDCELKGSGSQILQSSIASVTNIVKLDISDNPFDSDIISLLGWIQQNKSLKELNVGKTFLGMKPKYVKRAAEALSELIQEEDSVLESLSIADSKVRDHLFSFLGCIGSNTSLTSLDISGNLIGDAGSRVLAKSLQINSKLKILKFDRNSLSALGFHELASALERNFTLRYMPYPVNDVVAAMKHYPERTQSALARMQDLLLRNANSNRATNEQQFRLQKVVTNTAQQVLDKLAVKVDDAINALEILDSDSAGSDVVVTAKRLVRDANNSKQLLSDMYGLAMGKTSGHNSSFQEKMSDVAQKMDGLAQNHYKEIIEAMQRNAESQCPHMYEEIKDEIETSVKQRCPFPPGSVSDDVMKTSGADLVNRMSELNLSVATLVSDKVTDRLLDALSNCNTVLSEQLSEIKSGKKADSTSTKLSANGEESEGASKGSKVKGGSADELLPNIRKERAQSVAKRRQRPVASAAKDEALRNSSPSILISDELTLREEPDRRASAPPITDETKEDEAESISTVSKDVIESDDEILDAEPTQILDHVTKARPRGPNRRKRKQMRPETVVDTNVDDFFKKSVVDTDFTETPTLQEERVMKKKEVNDRKTKAVSSMGVPMVNVKALKNRTKEEADIKEETDEKAKETPHTHVPKARPKTMMAMPGMGFGGDLMAEMKKKKKLAKKPEDAKPEEKKKKSRSPEVKSKGNNSSNNNSTSVKPSVAGRPHKADDAAESEMAGSTQRAKLPMFPSTSLLGKTPPPLPTKPKPSLRAGNANKSRPVSEFHVLSPPSSLDKTRTSSLKDKDDKQ